MSRDWISGRALLLLLRRLSGGHPYASVCRFSELAQLFLAPGGDGESTGIVPKTLFGAEG